MKLETCVMYLKQLGADKIPHGSGTLLEHLSKTYNYLVSEEQDEDVCFAGLFHSIYGTKYFTHEITNDREAVRELIGDRAEYLVWKFCALDRTKFNWEDPDTEELYAIHQANRGTQNV